MKHMVINKRRYGYPGGLEELNFGQLRRLLSYRAGGSEAEGRNILTDLAGVAPRVLGRCDPADLERFLDAWSGRIEREVYRLSRERFPAACRFLGELGRDEGACVWTDALWWMAGYRAEETGRFERLSCLQFLGLLDSKLRVKSFENQYL